MREINGKYTYCLGWMRGTHAPVNFLSTSFSNDRQEWHSYTSESALTPSIDKPLELEKQRAGHITGEHGDY